MPKVYFPLTPERIRAVVISSTYPDGSSTEQRFLANLQQDDGCLIWQGRLNESGYGVLSVNGIRGAIRAHRVAWILANGPIPEGMDVLHSCDNPPCCEPTHLFLGTQDDNMKDMAGKGRNVAQAHPERMARGDRNGSRLHPEQLSRGDNHWTRARPQGLLKGSQNKQSKLTEEDVRIIRARYAAGELQRVIGKDYGILQTCVSQIVLRQSWKHVD